VYTAAAVDEALAVYSPHADIERTAQGDVWLIDVNCPDPVRERRIAGELGNYALGLTIRAQANVEVPGQRP
jgi:hypothetical protein